LSHAPTFRAQNGPTGGPFALYFRVSQVPTPGAVPQSSAPAGQSHRRVARSFGVERADAINIRIPIEGAADGLMAEGA
jgi:hypothetical protein